MFVGGGILIERHSKCECRVWRMSEELECLDGNSTLLLDAVWVHLCMHVCGFFFFFSFSLNNEHACFQLLHPCALKRPQSAGLILSPCVHAAYVWYFSGSHCASQLPDWLLCALAFSLNGSTLSDPTSRLWKDGGGQRAKKARLPTATAGRAGCCGGHLDQRPDRGSLESKVWKGSLRGG